METRIDPKVVLWTWK